MDAESLLASVPSPSEDDKRTRGEAALHYTLVFLRKSPAPCDDEVRNDRLQREHLQHLTKLQILGKLFLNGPILPEHDILGVSVYGEGLAETFALAKADPKSRRVT